MSSGLVQWLAQSGPIIYNLAITFLASTDQTAVKRRRACLLAATASLLKSSQFPAPSPRLAGLSFALNGFRAAGRGAAAIFPAGREFAVGSAGARPALP